MADALAPTGLLQVKSLAQMEQEAAARMAQLQASNAQSHPIVDGLSGHISKAWNSAKDAKRPIELTMIASMRQRLGEYDSDKYAAIKSIGGSEVFILLTLTKCRAALAWIKDTLRPVGDTVYTIAPTTMPDLPPDRVQAIMEHVQEVYQDTMAQLQQVAAVDPSVLPKLKDEVRLYTESLHDQELKEIQDDAQKRADRMKLKIDKQLVDGGWHEAFWGAIEDLVNLKAGIIKGPVLRNKPVASWGQDGTGGAVAGYPNLGGGNWKLTTTIKTVPEFDRVSPFDFYPAPGAADPNDGDMIERRFFLRKDLASLIEVEGYDSDRIRMVLSENSNGGKRQEVLTVDTERYYLEHRETSTFDQTGKIEGLEYWGSVPGALLIDWGMKDQQLDPQMEYEVNAIKIGVHVIKAVLNPDLLGRKPYSVSGFEKTNGSIWSMGIPELMADVQNVCNATGRAMVNNAGLAAGPIIEQNVDRCSDTSDLHPFKVFQSTNQQMLEAPALRFYQPTVIVGPLMQVFDKFSLMADEQTGIPRWAQGNTQVGGAGDTSSGLSMLMTYAARGVKQVITNVDDDFISPTIQRMYDYNMAYDPDPMIKGDATVVAKGSSSLIAKEQRGMRLKELLAVSNNPVDVPLLTPAARLDMWRQTFKAMEMDTSKLPNPNDLPAILAAIEEKEQQQMALQNQQKGGWKGVVPGKKEQQADLAGDPAGGTDSNLFQNQPGSSPNGMVATA